MFKPSRGLSSKARDSLGPFRVVAPRYSIPLGTEATGQPWGAGEQGEDRATSCLLTPGPFLRKLRGPWRKQS